MGSVRLTCRLAMASVVALLGSLMPAGAGSALDCDITGIEIISIVPCE